MINKIALVCGDPYSVNSEIIYKLWCKLDSKTKKKIYLIGNFDLICSQLKKLKKKIIVSKVNNINDDIDSSKFKIINLPLNFTKPFNVSPKNSSKYVIQCLNLAHELALNKKVKGIINCPINKKLIKSSNKVGVTEFLASKCNIKDKSEVMLIFNKKLSVVPLTTHINIKDVSNTINKNLIIKKINTIDKYYKKIFKKKAKIGILGLNPHNDELQKNSEEVKKILPAIKKLNQKGFKVNGPLVADTVFVDNYKKFNILVGMYHDQVLSPFKTLFHFDAINITLGLKYLRVSPDHGPATDLIGKNKANFFSLLQCVKFINNLK